MDECEGCYFNRPMKAWGEIVQACFYKLEIQKELETSNDGQCGGYEKMEKQIELDFNSI